MLVLTELFVVGGWPAEQASPDQDLQVVEEDEGWRCGRAAMVLLNQIVPLELPDLVRVLLDLLEGVAGAEPRRQQCHGDEGAHHVCMVPRLLPGSLISPGHYLLLLPPYLKPPQSTPVLWSACAPGPCLRFLSVRCPGHGQACKQSQLHSLSGPWGQVKLT